MSQWGQDFRPSYQHIRQFADLLPAPVPVGAFTATATARVKEDIRAMLALRDPLEVATGFDRPNLWFEVQRLRPKEKYTALTMYLAEHPDASGIVYCATRKAVDEVYGKLAADGYAAARYHAGLDAGERRKSQDAFVYDQVRVMVATNAFGMGIDKSDVRFVVHYNMPKDLESYYQEAGRAGRDGEISDCVLLFAKSDVTTQRFLIDKMGEEGDLEGEALAEARRAAWQRLDQMTAYCQTDACLRA